MTCSDCIYATEDGDAIVCNKPRLLYFGVKRSRSDTCEYWKARE